MFGKGGYKILPASVNRNMQIGEKVKGLRGNPPSRKAAVGRQDKGTKEKR